MPDHREAYRFVVKAPIRSQTLACSKKGGLGKPARKTRFDFALEVYADVQLDETPILRARANPPS
jgi:hypothetical protein